MDLKKVTQQLLAGYFMCEEIWSFFFSFGFFFLASFIVFLLSSFLLLFFSPISCRV